MFIDRTSLYRLLSDDLFGFFIEPLLVEQLYADALELYRKVLPTPTQISVFDRIYQLRSINRKADSGSLDDALVKAAIEKLHATEAEMRLLNASTPWRSSDWYQAAIHLINQVLPPLDTVAVGSYFKFGPGSTFGGKGPVGRHLLSKIGGTQTVTRGAMLQAHDIISEAAPHWFDTLGGLPCRYVKGNRVAFVPKDSTKVRQIAIEPSLNMGLQLAVGGFLTDRLRLFGVNLRDQSMNQVLAKEGSIHRNLATIDLSDASNRISRRLVCDLLPPDWGAFLSALRSPQGLLPDGTHIEYHSFSTQGNGFTFPLESLIFWAISKTAGAKRVRVYGDDIIIDTNSATSVIDALEICGFLVNSDKSYVDGSFKESCGADYLNGVNVRPVFYKTDAVNPGDVANLHNQLYCKFGYDKSSQTLEFLRSCVKEPLFGPPALFSSNESKMGNECSYRWRDWFWKIQLEPYKKIHLGYHLAPLRIKVRSTNYAKYLCFLYGGNKALSSSSVTRMTVRRISVGDRSYTPQSLLNISQWDTQRAAK